MRQKPKLPRETCSNKAGVVVGCFHVDTKTKEVMEKSRVTYRMRCKKAT